jgi:hypothetical protein
MNAFVLWITVLSGPLDGVTYGIPYQTEEACRAAKRDVSRTLDYDHQMECERHSLKEEPPTVLKGQHQ